MKVKLLTPLSGSKGSFACGEEYECSQAEAERLVEKGFAEYDAKTQAKLEKEAKAAADKAAKAEKEAKAAADKAAKAEAAAKAKAEKEAKAAAKKEAANKSKKSAGDKK